MRTAQDLLSELNASNGSTRIEVERAREIGKFIRETAIAFTNDRDWMLATGGNSNSNSIAEGRQPVTFCHALKLQAPSLRY